LVLRFPNNPPVFQGISTEVFNLVANSGSGLAASAFSVSLPKNLGGPSFYSVASFTNASGTGVGTAYVTQSAVPLPAAAWLLVSGVGALSAAMRRRKTT
jgi:hypothetical protein